MRLICTRAILAAAVVILLASSASAGAVMFNFSGHITNSTDAMGNPVSFAPIPIASTFNGFFSYDSAAPQTASWPVNEYCDSVGGAMHITINGYHLMTASLGSKNPFIHFDSISSLTTPLDTYDTRVYPTGMIDSLSPVHEPSEFLFPCLGLGAIGLAAWCRKK